MLSVDFFRRLVLFGLVRVMVYPIVPAPVPPIMDPCALRLTRGISSLQPTFSRILIGYCHKSMSVMTRAFGRLEGGEIVLVGFLSNVAMQAGCLVLVLGLMVGVVLIRLFLPLA